MADDEPLKNCTTCQFGEHFPSNGEPSKFLCTRDIGEYFGEYIWEDSEEIEKNFVCHQEPQDDETNTTKMQGLSTDISKTILPFGMPWATRGDYADG